MREERQRGWVEQRDVLAGWRKSGGNHGEDSEGKYGDNGGPGNDSSQKEEQEEEKGGDIANAFLRQIFAI